jgi:hydrogenase maturation protease
MPASLSSLRCHAVSRIARMARMGGSRWRRAASGGKPMKIARRKQGREKRKAHRPPRALVIGIGNPLRQDDAVGRIVVRRIQDRHPALAVIEHSGEGASLMELWKRADVVFVVDCVCSGSAAGTVHRFDASRQSLSGQAFPVSTHGFGLQEAVEMARALNQLPRRLIIYGIEGKAFGNGRNLSAAVDRAVPQAVRRILAEATTTAGRSGSRQRAPNSRSPRGKTGNGA